MKKTSSILLLATLALWGCSESTTKKSSTTNNTPIVDQYCAQNPSLCNGTTTGSTGGGTTGGGGVGQYPTYSPITATNNWGDLYGKNGSNFTDTTYKTQAAYNIPAGYCESTTGTGYETRKATITLAGGVMYVPSLSWTAGGSSWAAARYQHNVSPHLTTVPKAKAFFQTDHHLKVRFKVKPQPTTKGEEKPWCFGQVSSGSYLAYGYRNLDFSVALRKLNSDGSVGDFLKVVSGVKAGLNSCTQGIDFSGLQGDAPYGAVISVFSVKADQDCWYAPCTAYKVMDQDLCWSMDMEVSVDGTKDFPTSL